MDEVNHVNMVVSFVVLCCACLFSFCIMLILYKGLLVEKVNNHVFVDT